MTRSHLDDICPLLYSCLQNSFRTPFFIMNTPITSKWTSSCRACQSPSGARFLAAASRVLCSSDFSFAGFRRFSSCYIKGVEGRGGRRARRVVSRRGRAENLRVASGIRCHSEFQSKRHRPRGAGVTCNIPPLGPEELCQARVDGSQ